MKSTKPIHYIIVIIIAIAFMGLMRFRAVKQNPSLKSSDFDISVINTHEASTFKTK